MNKHLIWISLLVSELLIKKTLLGGLGHKELDMREIKKEEDNRPICS